MKLRIDGIYRKSRLEPSYYAERMQEIIDEVIASQMVKQKKRWWQRESRGSAVI